VHRAAMLGIAYRDSTVRDDFVAWFFETIFDRSVAEYNRTAMLGIAYCDCTFRDDFVARLHLENRITKPTSIGIIRSLGESEG